MATILVLDEEGGIADILCRTLEEEEYIVMDAHNDYEMHSAKKNAQISFSCCLIAFLPEEKDNTFQKFL